MIGNDKTMKAIYQNSFGNEEKLVLGNLPMPIIGADDILIKIKYAGIGQWDPFEREGGYAEMLGLKAEFPYILGSEGVGVIEKIGESVTHYEVGDRVYAAGFLNARGGFYAEYVSVHKDFVSPAIENYSDEELAGIAGVGLTVLRGLEDILKLKRGDSIIIHGASGAMGHIALQLAKVLGANTIAIASGKDGVTLCEGLGADLVIDGRQAGAIQSIKKSFPGLIDYVFLTTSPVPDLADNSILKENAKIAYPHGVMISSELNTNFQWEGFYGNPDKDILSRLHEHLKHSKVKVHISSVFTMDDIKIAHRALERHHLGKLILRVS